MAEPVDYPLIGDVLTKRRPDAVIGAGALAKFLQKEQAAGRDCEFFFGCRAAGSGDGDFAIYVFMQEAK